MRRTPIFISLVAALLFAGCATAPTSRTYASSASATGSVRTTVRAATDGTMEPGPQEIIGLYIPFIGTGLAIRAGLIMESLPSGPITIPVPVNSASVQSTGCGCAPAVQYQAETYTEYVEQTIMVPQKRVVPVQKTRMVPYRLVPQRVDPCAPGATSKAEADTCGAG